MHSARKMRLALVFLACLLLLGVALASSAFADQPTGSVGNPAAPGVITAPTSWDPSVLQPASRYVAREFTDKSGKTVVEMVFPGRPPANFRAAAVNPPVDMTGILTLTKVPAFDWSYGCSATAAAMIMGFYDNNKYTNMYAGPTNSGLMPMNNAAWGPGECPLSATHQGYDGLATKGHVNDYWIEYLSEAPDPYVGNWTEHTWADCTADFMGTNQSKYANVDGSTSFYLDPSGERLYDFSGAEPASRDGCHGLRQFVESRGYRVAANYTQYIMGYSGLTNGFTFGDFVKEIDAGRPVMIHVSGHSMVGYGYNTTGSLIYIHDTWDYSDHTMPWGGAYEGLQHFAVSVFQLAPPPPSILSITPKTGLNNGVLSITNLAGANFNPGASVVLSKAGESDIVGTSVSVPTSAKITCDLNLAGKAPGQWNVTVTNPDGQFDTLENGFTILEGDPIPVTINQAAGQADPTNGSVINFTAVFDQTMVDFTGEAVAISGTAGGTKVATVTGSGKTYNVAISGMTGTGTVIVSIPKNGVHNAIGAPNAASTSTDNQVSYDGTPPAITIGAPSVAETRGGPVTYTVTFTDAITVAMTSAEVTLNKTGTADGTVEVSGDGTAERVVTISDISGDGELSIILAAGVAVDSIGNTSPVIGPSDSFVVDNTGPQPVITGPDDALTTSGPVVFTVSYADAASISLSAADVSLNSTGTAAGIVSVTGSDPGLRYVEITNTTGDGTLSISLATGTALDALGNPGLAAGPSDPTTVDNTGPIVGIVGPDPAKTNHGPVRYILEYPDATSVSLTLSDIIVHKTGTAKATASVSGSGNSLRTVLLNDITGTGTLSISVAAGSAVDLAGNESPASLVSETVLVDNQGPVVTIGPPSVTSTTSGPVTYVLSFTDSAKIALDSTKVVLNKTNTANGVVTVSGVGLLNRTVTVSSITGSGQLGISILASAAMDNLGNWSAAAGPSAKFSVDSEAPFLNVSGPSPSSTKSGPVTYTVTYTDAAVVTLAAADITLNRTGTANGTVAVTGTGKTNRVITMSGISGDGSLGISIAAGTAADTAGNESLAYGPSPTVKVDNTGPAISVLKPSNLDKFSRNSNELTLSGTATDASGTSRMSWYLEGGTPTACAGTATWSTSTIALAEGVNRVVLEAEDTAGNVAQKTVEVSFVRTNAGAAWHAIAMVSIPVIPDYTDPKLVVGFSANNWQMYRPETGAYSGYPESATWFTPVENAPGRGFWAAFSTDGRSAVGTIPAQNVERTIDLKRGWNIIGVPFIKPVKWDVDAVKVEVAGVRKSLAASADVLSNFAWGWNSTTGAYFLVADASVGAGATDLLQPWQAYWVKATSACKLVLPAP